MEGKFFRNRSGGKCQYFDLLKRGKFIQVQGISIVSYSEIQIRSEKKDLQDSSPSDISSSLRLMNSILRFIFFV